MPEDFDQIAVLVYASNINHETLGGGKLMTADQFIEEIFLELRDKKLESKVVPEQFIILYSFQYVNQYRDVISKVWKNQGK